jgi:hypothetical protein
MGREVLDRPDPAGEQPRVGPAELRQIERIVEEKQVLLMRAWHEYFGHKS